MRLVASKHRLRAAQVRELLNVVQAANRANPTSQLLAASEALEAAVKLADAPPSSLGHKASLRRFAEALELLSALQWSKALLDSAIRASVTSVN